MSNQSHQRDELYHHGVKGMKWGKHIFGENDNIKSRKSKQNISNSHQPNIIEKHKNNLIANYKEIYANV